MLTSHPKVYACGDITGYSMLAHTAIRESEVAINHILGVEDRMNYHCVPGWYIRILNWPEWENGRGVESIRDQLSCTEITDGLFGAFRGRNETGNGLCKLIWMRKTAL